jgi:DNA-binding LytR/AlgR family response regulator
MMRALLADDEPHLTEFLVNRLAELMPDLDVVGTAANGLEALALIDRERPDVVFLDIKMPGLSGLEVAARLGDAAPRIVFVTAFDDYAVQAFEHHAVDYLLKPVSDERLQRTITQLRRVRVRDQPVDLAALAARLSSVIEGARSGSPYLRWLRASLGDSVLQIAVEDVIALRASDKYTILDSTRPKPHPELLIRTSLSELLERLDPDVFWQIHRSTVVNLAFVESVRKDVFGKTFATLSDQHGELAVSRHFAHRFKQM